MSNPKRPPQYLDWGDDHLTDGSGDFNHGYSTASNTDPNNPSNPADPVVLPDVLFRKDGHAHEDFVPFNWLNGILAWLSNATKFSIHLADNHVHGSTDPEIGVPAIDPTIGIDWKGGQAFDGGEIEVVDNTAAVHHILHQVVGSAETMFQTDIIRAEKHRFGSAVEVQDLSNTANAYRLKATDAAGFHGSAFRAENANRSDGLPASYGAEFPPNESLYQDNLTKVIGRYRVNKPAGSNTVTVTRLAGYNDTNLNWSLISGKWSASILNAPNAIGSVTSSIYQDPLANTSDVVRFDIKYVGGAMNFNAGIRLPNGGSPLIKTLDEIAANDPGVLIDFEFCFELK